MCLPASLSAGIVHTVGTTHAYSRLFALQRLCTAEVPSEGTVQLALSVCVPHFECMHLLLCAKCLHQDWSCLHVVF